MTAGLIVGFILGGLFGIAIMAILAICKDEPQQHLGGEELDPEYARGKGGHFDERA